MLLNLETSLLPFLLVSAFCFSVLTRRNAGSEEHFLKFPNFNIAMRMHCGFVNSSVKTYLRWDEYQSDQ